MARFLVMGALAALSISFCSASLAQDKSKTPADAASKQEAAPQLSRIIRTDGRVFEGEVTETADGYQVKVPTGKSGGSITVSIKRNEVKSITKLEPEKTEGPELSSRLHAISDGELADILGETPAILKGIAANPYQMLRDELPLDRASVDEMLKIAGKKADEYRTKHFIFVYTSDRAQAVALAARLESIYDWVVKYMEQLSIPPARPKAKLEIFYFGTYDEFTAYQTLNGMLSSGILGFYMRTNNRSSFFDMRDYPPYARALAQLKEKGIDPQMRRKLTNQIDDYTGFMNLTVIQHEAAHHVHFNLGVYQRKLDGSVPRWMTEGLATMFEVPPTAEGGSLGSINYSRLNEFRQIFKNVDKTVSPEAMRLFVIGRTDLGNNYFNYVMGWALNHYLRTAHRPEYAKWMQLLAARGDPRVAELTPTVAQKEFEDLFGVIDEAWMKAFAKFMNELEFKPSALTKDPFRP